MNIVITSQVIVGLRQHNLFSLIQISFEGKQRFD